MEEKGDQISLPEGSLSWAKSPKERTAAMPATPLEWADALQAVLDGSAIDAPRLWNRLFRHGISRFAEKDECRTSNGVPACRLFAMARMRWKGVNELRVKRIPAEMFADARGEDGMTTLEWMEARPRPRKDHWGGLDAGIVASKIPGMSKRTREALFDSPVLFDLLLLGASAENVDVLPYAEAAMLTSGLLPRTEILPCWMILAGADHSFLSNPRWNDLPGRQRIQAFIDEQVLQAAVS